MLPTPYPYINIQGEGDSDVINTTCNKQDYLLYIAYPAQQLFGPGPWVPGPYPLWLNICATRAINRQYITGNLAYYMMCL